MDYNLLSYYTKPNTFIDIGAHIGDFTQHILKISPQCSCYLIEANPNCEPYIQRLNQPYQIVGLSSKQSTSELYVENSNHIGTGASIYKENTQFYGEGKYHKIPIQTTTLDNLNLFPEKVIDLIKIDTQGSELDILVGGIKTIKRTKYLILEVSVLHYNDNTPLIDTIMSKVREYSFKIEDILDYKYLNNQVFQMDFLIKNTYL